MAGQTTSSRWGELVFDKKGNCEVDDDVGREFLKAGVRGYKVHGLPPDEEEGDVDDEELNDEDLELSADDSEGEATKDKPARTKSAKKKLKKS
jgi:hypothetical protein